MKKRDLALTIVFVAFIAVFAVLLAALPKTSYSENEKRVLSNFPELTFETLTDGDFSSGIDTYTSDHFPFRDAFVGLNSYFELYTGRNGASGVYKCKDGYLIAAPEKPDLELTKRNVERFSEFAQQNGLSAKLMVVPTAGYIMDDVLPKNHEAYHDDEVFSAVKENLNNLTLIDLRDVYKEQAKEKQLYYKTDHHVTSEGAYLMYKSYCENSAIAPIEEFGNKEVLQGFYGTNYSKSGLWGEKPDTLEIWHSSTGNTFSVIVDDVTSKNTYDSLYFMEHDKNMDKYPVFLNGNHAVVTVKNNEVKNGKKLLVIKDSFAHCFATFLCENYEQITMVDLRYYRQSVSELVSNEGLNEMLVLYGTDNLVSSTDVAWLQ